jgi:hypothetical protein
MRVDSAILRLRNRFSDEDPIKIRGKYFTPRDLEDDWTADATVIKITYWSGVRDRWIRGTLSDMVHDRERDPAISPADDA